MESITGKIIFNFIIRGVVGFCLIFLINQMCLYQGLPVSVGMNLCTFMTTGSLGIPGVGLLYGIMFYQIL